MAKKETRLLICYCSTKKKLPKSEMVVGESCFCLPYNTKPGKGTKYNSVIIH